MAVRPLYVLFGAVPRAEMRQTHQFVHEQEKDKSAPGDPPKKMSQYLGPGSGDPVTKHRLTRKAKCLQGACYSGSLLFVVLSHSMLSSLGVGDGKAPAAPPGRSLSRWKRLHSGQMRMWLQPLATNAAS